MTSASGGIRRTWPAWIYMPRTVLVAGAIGSLLGLGMAGVGLFTAKGTSIRGIPAEDVAVVNGSPILQSDLIAQVESTTGKPYAAASPAERKAVLAALVREELFVQRALELDEPGTDPDSRAALVAAVQQQVAVDATSVVPTDAQLRAFYSERPDRYSTIGVMTVRDLIAAKPTSPAVLTEAADELRRGKPPDSIVKRFGLKDSGRVNGEELYFAAKLHLGDRHFAAAEGLPDGGVAGPIEGDDGPHILVVIHNDRPKAKSFEDARGQVYGDFKEDLVNRLRDGEYKYLRGKADIQIVRTLR